MLLLCFLLSHVFIYFAELRAKHKMDLENLTLTKQPLRTLHLFLLAVLQYLKRLAKYILSKGGLFFLLIVLVVAPGILLAISDGVHKKVCSHSNAFFINLWDRLVIFIRTPVTVFFCHRVCPIMPKYSRKIHALKICIFVR